MSEDGIFLPLPVDFAEDPDVSKLARYGPDACAIRDLLVQMLCYCKRKLSDGYIPIEQVGKLVYPDSAETGLWRADQLVKVGIAEQTPDAYFLPMFLDNPRNMTRAQVDERREVRKKAGHLGGIASGEMRRSKTEANAKQVASEVNQVRSKRTRSKTEANTKRETETEAQAETEAKNKTRTEEKSNHAGTVEPEPDHAGTLTLEQQRAIAFGRVTS
jgi:hypothetical protein